ncbi:MAG: co-chaperone DjlA [Rhodospirillales bacterium]|nr:co-chaperone DjlA [Rhodospirillales bacterium]MBO6787212.1 co-chaperone DjlA [Rhodospirillales bacterium]
MSVWGKVIGGIAGLAVGGPIGAVIGAVAGHHVVDKKKAGELNQDDKQVAFTTAVIVLSAKMAKADGRVTRDEVDAFKQLFHIEPEDVPTVAAIFDEAKQNAEGFEPYAEQIGDMFKGDWHLLEEIIGAQFHIAKADGVIHPGEVEYLRKVALLFGFTERDFDRLQTIYLGGWQGEGGRSFRADDAYQVLGVSKEASDADIKKAYRDLVRENHPDTLMAKGMPEEFIELANEKLAKINDAYDRIKKARGFS